MDTAVHSYRFPRPSVTTDVVAFCVHEGELEILLIERGEAPAGLALPGGFLQVGARDTELAVAAGALVPPAAVDLSLEACARRELLEETGLDLGTLHQIGAFGDADRDPRGRYITVAYWGFADRTRHRPRAGSDAAGVVWRRADHLPGLAFRDHAIIIATARQALQARRHETGLFVDLMPARFTYPDFHRAFEIATGAPIDRSSLHRRIQPWLKDAVVAPADEAPPSRGAHRPALVYDRRKVLEALAAGPGLQACR